MSEVRDSVSHAARTSLHDPREVAHIACDCVPDLGPEHCHLCSNRNGKETPWSECSARKVAEAEPSEAQCVEIANRIQRSLGVAIYPSTVRAILHDVGIFSPGSSHEGSSPEPSDEQVLRALSAHEAADRDGEPINRTLDQWSKLSIARMRAALRAAGVAAVPVEWEYTAGVLCQGFSPEFWISSFEEVTPEIDEAREQMHKDLDSGVLSYATLLRRRPASAWEPVPEGGEG